MGKVVILGLGKTGLSCVNYFLRKGITPIVLDTRQNPPGMNELPASVELLTGPWDESRLLCADLIVSSPGIALSTPALQKALQAGIEIIGDIELFVREAKAPVVAITGSNGKSTVTTLVGEMAQEAGIPVGVGGNIGTPALDLLLSPASLYVLELSSFQLETTHSLRAAAATILTWIAMMGWMTIWRPNAKFTRVPRRLSVIGTTRLPCLCLEVSGRVLVLMRTLTDE